MKITMYELLGLVKDGKVPEKIKFNNYEYLYHDKEHGYCRNNYDCTYICLDSEYYLFDILNDEVEILEKKKIPEKLKEYGGWSKDDVENNATEFLIIKQKINEIIDYLDYLKSKGE